MEMATAAAAEVHRRSEAIGDLFLPRNRLASTENRKLGLGQSRDWRTCAAAPPRTPGSRAADDESTEDGVSTLETEQLTKKLRRVPLVPSLSSANG